MSDSETYSGRYHIDLVRQMAICDANFIRLLKLMPELESYRITCLRSLAGIASERRHDDCNESAIAAFSVKDFYSVGDNISDSGCIREFFVASPVDEAVEVKVRIRVVEVFRYTTTLEIAQLTRISDWIEPPAIMIRLYHDATTAEAIAFQGHKGFLARYAAPNSKMYQQDEKRQINEFLGEWLSLCLQAGRSLTSPAFVCTA